MEKNWSKKLIDIFMNPFMYESIPVPHGFQRKVIDWLNDKKHFGELKKLEQFWIDTNPKAAKKFLVVPPSAVSKLHNLQVKITRHKAALKRERRQRIRNHKRLFNCL